jgi:quercetin dioxygenase-like cupin family protein
VYVTGSLEHLDPSAAVYGGHSRSYERRALVSRTAGSVQQEVAVVELAPGGSVDRHLHAFEEALFVLGGTVTLAVAGTDAQLAQNDYGLLEHGVPHALRNDSTASARWLEVSAPPPGAGGLQDTLFVGDGVAGSDTETPLRRGRFEENQLPEASGTLGLAGFGGGNVEGARLKMLIDRDFGASQLNLLLLEYVPGGNIKEHDHAFEEAFFFLSGEIEAKLEGETHTLRAGDYCWSSAQSMHALANRSDAPVRWLETQIPQPPQRFAARFKGDWERLTE